MAANTAILQKLGGAGVADLCLVQETNMPLSNLEELEELERQLGSDIDLKNQLVSLDFKMLQYEFEGIQVLTWLS